MAMPEPPKDEAITNLRCLGALHAAGLLDSRRIPQIATWLLARGLETPEIVTLAGMDLAPFLPIDASELFDLTLVSLSVLPFERADEVRVALGAAAAVHLDGGLGPENLMAIGGRLAAQYDYPDDVMGLYGLEDEWQGGWGRTREAIVTEVREIAMEALRRSPEVRACDPELLSLALSAVAPNK